MDLDHDEAFSLFLSKDCIGNVQISLFFWDFPVLDLRLFNEIVTLVYTIPHREYYY
jgi:hypothetical protein